MIYRRVKNPRSFARERPTGGLAIEWAGVEFLSDADAKQPLNWKVNFFLHFREKHFAETGTMLLGGGGSGREGEGYPQKSTVCACDHHRRAEKGISSCGTDIPKLANLGNL